MKNLVLCLLLSLSTSVFAGNSDKEKALTRTLAGKIADTAGESLPGATLRISETGETFFADLDGNFKITVSSDKIYTISIQTIGHAPLQVKSSGLSAFSEISLSPL